jgi:predicted secreted protein
MVARRGSGGRTLLVVVAVAALAGVLAVGALVVIATQIDNGVPEPDAVLTPQRPTATVEVGDLVHVHVASSTPVGDDWRYETPGGLRYLSKEVRLDGDDDESGGTLVVMFEVDAPGTQELPFTRCLDEACKGPDAERIDFELRAS